MKKISILSVALCLFAKAYSQYVAPNPNFYQYVGNYFSENPSNPTDFEDGFNEEVKRPCSFYNN